MFGGFWGITWISGGNGGGGGQSSPTESKGDYGRFTANYEGRILRIWQSLMGDQGNVFKSSTRFEKEVKGNSEMDNFVLELRETYLRQRITFFDEM